MCKFSNFGGECAMNWEKKVNFAHIKCGGSTTEQAADCYSKIQLND
jgi:hypothetical protein